MEYKFPEELMLEAEIIALARQAKNSKLMEQTKGSQFDRGDKNFNVDYIGCLGELIARQYLKDKGMEFEYGELVQDRPSKEADITLNGQRIDVKSKVNRGNLIEVNQRAHKKGRGLIDSYWFVNIDEKTCTALFKTVSYAQVSQWNLHYYERYNNHAYQNTI